MAMPPPMVPAPITAARSIFVTGVSFGTSGTFAASRSAKNMCTSARDSSEVTQSANSSRSRAEPFSKSSVNAPSMASTALNGASTPLRGLRQCRARRRARGDAALLIGDLVGQLAGLPDPRRGGRRLRKPDRLVQEDRPARRDRRCPPASPWTASTGFPAVHISMASSAPQSRGSRCVPPAPGMMPSSTSGWPTFASWAITR